MHAVVPKEGLAQFIKDLTVGEVREGVTDRFFRLVDPSESADNCSLLG